MIVQECFLTKSRAGELGRLLEHSDMALRNELSSVATH